MSQNIPDSAAILAVHVGPAAGSVRLVRKPASLHEQQTRYVRDLFVTAGGDELDSAASDVSFHFGTWRRAIAAAIELTSEVSRLTTRLAGMQVGIGLDLRDAPDDPDDLARAAAIARLAEPNEIRLGEALAAVARHDPPDRRVVKGVDGELSPGRKIVFRLANARDEIPNNLAAAMTSFVGREAELREVGGLLAQVRLVTVTGPPGAGKTRLATELAERLLGRFDGGAWFVGLAPIADPRLMLSSLADALGLLPPPDRSLIDAISTQIENRDVLLVLDNFEHITDAAADLATLLAAAPTLRILATSRTPLHVSGEHEYPIPPLELPRLASTADEVVRSEAGDLFARRAKASQPTFLVGDENASQVGELCRRLDGLPLAIELAAARVKILSLAGILARLDHRLALLTGGPRDLPARHQSLRAAVAWSYDLLEPSTRRLFQRLSVFRGGWTSEGAAAVDRPEGSDVDGVFDALVSLVDGSLVVRLAPDASVPRFTMLETLKEFAAERLDEAGDTDDARAQHAAYCLGLVERWAPDFTGPDQATALDTIAIEHDNIRAALAYQLAADSEDALRLAAGIWRFWQMRGHLVEGSLWLAQGLQAVGGDARNDVRANALEAAGGLAYWRGDMAEAQSYYERALTVRRTIGDQVGLAGALYDLAFVFHPSFSPPPEDPERTSQAASLLEEAEGLNRKANNELGIAKCGWLLGTLMLYRDIDQARSLLGTSVERFRALNDPFGLGWALRTYGQALLGSADSAGAARAFGEALKLFSAAQDGSAMGMLLDEFSEVAKAEGDPIRAARLNGAAAAMRHVTEAELAFTDGTPWLRSTTQSGDLADSGDLERAWAEGLAMSQPAATLYALGSDATGLPDRALRVNSLGPFRVERSGEPISQWGGPKAGSRQAQAMFAFLLDRDERGVTKDEFIDVIWPDADVAQADLNFHRTLGGLRDTLEPDRAAVGSAVTFGNGRYRLNSSIVGWLDATEFEQRLMNAARATDDLAAIRGLEAARAMYRGDYLDDCPLYGDSGYVEGRRGDLRGRLIDALVDLGRRYEARAEPTLAAARFREAITISGGECSSAEDGLKRLGVPVA